jgi:hypothetical protein
LPEFDKIETRGWGYIYNNVPAISEMSISSIPLKDKDTLNFRNDAALRSWLIGNNVTNQSYSSFSSSNNAMTDENLYKYRLPGWKL